VYRRALDMRPRIRTIAALGLAAVLALALLRARDPALEVADPTPEPTSPSAATPAEPAPAAAPAPEAGPALPPPPASLRDTEPDGALVLGPDGRFVPTPSALAFFDYWLSASGEEPPAAIRARIVAAIGARLPAAAAPDAVALLDRYLGFREAVRALASDPELAASGDLERRLQWIGELRREHFGAALAETLFGAQEQEWRVAIALRRLAADPTLTPEERARRRVALEAELPEAARRAREQARAPLALREEEAALRAAGGDEGDVQALREARFGPEAAARLAALDERRAAWQGRLDAWREERARLLADPALDEAARAEAVEAARAARFEPSEQLRVRALEAAEPGQ
jgi:lipase chaperone LimK